MINGTLEQNWKQRDFFFWIVKKKEKKLFALSNSDKGEEELESMEREEQQNSWNYILKV